MGRPPKSGDRAMAARLEIRVDPVEKADYAAAAQAAGMECSDWIRATLNAAAKRKLRKQAGSGRNKSSEGSTQKAEEE